MADWQADEAGRSGAARDLRAERVQAAPPKQQQQQQQPPSPPPSRLANAGEREEESGLQHSATCSGNNFRRWSRNLR